MPTSRGAPLSPPAVDIGIDVGGARKGFHAVALDGVHVVARLRSRDPFEVAGWCRAQNARVVAVDAPCRWRGAGPARAAERQLAAAGIACYFTPTEERARGHAFYGWMLAGAALYAALQPHFPLYAGNDATGRVCVETFPQAVACALAGQIVSAKDKRAVRTRLLRQAGIALTGDESQDDVDALLCALTATALATGDFKAYGDARDGHIIVPANSLPANAPHDTP